MIAQIQLTHVPDPQHARIRSWSARADPRVCDACDPMLVKLGGGFRDLEVRVIETRGGPMVITHLIVDTRDAMGANAVNTMAEKIAPMIAGWTGGRSNLRILSNLADRRLARARCTWPLAASAAKRCATPCSRPTTLPTPTPTAPPPTTRAS
jgi:hydroxymethylglutaryl-CoA reductase